MSKQDLELLERSKSVRVWFDKLALRKSGSKRTEKIYHDSLRRFCKYHRIENPDSLVDGYNQVKYDLREREKIHDKLTTMIDGFASYMLRKGLAKTTIARETTAVKSFFKYNDVDLRWTPIKPRMPETIDKVPTLADLQKISDYLSPKGYMRAVFWFLVQSGLRLGTVLHLRYSSIREDFEAGKTPCIVVVPREITKGRILEHYTFIGSEAIDYLRLYLDKRKRGTESLSPEDITDDSLLFRANLKAEKPVVHGSVENEFREACLNLGLMKKGPYRKASKIRIHTLRKFFRTYANSAGYTWVHFWMGHKLHNNDETYFHGPETVQESREAYASILRYISPSVAQMKNGRITELEQENIRLKQELTHLKELVDSRSSDDYIFKRMKEILPRILSQDPRVRRTRRYAETLNWAGTKYLEALDEFISKAGEIPKQEMQKLIHNNGELRWFLKEIKNTTFAEEPDVTYVCNECLSTINESLKYAVGEFRENLVNTKMVIKELLTIQDETSG